MLFLNCESRLHPLPRAAAVRCTALVTVVTLAVYHAQADEPNAEGFAA